MRVPLVSLALTLSAIATAFPTNEPRVQGTDSSLEPLVELGSTSSTRYHNKVYLIRHGEKGSKGETGLNNKGKKRAKCLKQMLATPRFKIGLILAEDYDRKTHKRKRPFDTVKPIADHLGLKVDTDCQVDDAKCVRKKVEQYAKAGGTGDVLICWKHSMLHTIVKALGAPKTRPYPDDRYDIMWTLHHSRLVSKESEHCPGLDLKKSRKHDPELEVPPKFDDEDEDDEGDEKDEEDVTLLEDLEWLSSSASQASGKQLRLVDLD
ncbi:uncharacterized protein JCM15063_002019 [Sporobolomyces koalae]|uniref:uncharacterized protein n=1 Tax=Sporobolomyces koalae TaxID=500713 RepID=UPI00316DAC5A